MLLQQKAQQCQLLRDKFDTLFQTELYSVEQAASYAQQLNDLLNSPKAPEDSAVEYAEFLQQNLDWLQKIMAQLTEQKEVVAESMLTIQKGRRARHSYGQHN